MNGYPRKGLNKTIHSITKICKNFETSKTDWKFALYVFFIKTMYRTYLKTLCNSKFNVIIILCIEQVGVHNQIIKHLMVNVSWNRYNDYSHENSW